MKTKWLLTALVGGTVLLGACTAYPVQDPYYDYDQPVRVAPPTPYYEYPGYPPIVGHVWVSGYWNWAGVRYVWVPGRWEAPRPGYLWVPHRWERDGNHWRRHGGRWEHDPHPRVAPAPMLRPPPEREAVPERNVAPRSERESRRPAIEGSAPLPERHAEPRVETRGEREARSVPERNGDPRAEGKDRRRPHPDDDRREHRRDRDGER